MDEPSLVRLSELGESSAAPSTRRDFLSQASALTLAIPALGAALTACSSPAARKDSTAVAAGEQKGEREREHNSDSRLDSAVLKDEHHVAPKTATPAGADESRAFHRAAARAPSAPVRRSASASLSCARGARPHRRRPPSWRRGPSRATCPARSCTLPRRRHGRVHADERRGRPALDGLSRGADRSEGRVPLGPEGRVGDVTPSSRSGPARSCITAAPRRC